MIFETIVMLWMLYMLKAPLWIWIVACLAAIEAFYDQYKLNKLNNAFKSFIRISTEGLDYISAKIKEREKERQNGKETENNSDAE